MKIVTAAALFVLIGLFAAHSAVAAPGAPNGITLRATRTALLADGKSFTDIIAQVYDSSGSPANYVNVQFQTTSGTLSEPVVQTFAGVARVRLTSSPVAGVAHVTAFTAGAASATLDVVFTNDPEATFAGNTYISVSAKGYLAYSATDRAIEALGAPAKARLTYRNLDLTADRIQLRCDDLIVRAQDNVTLKRAGKAVKLTRLYYSIPQGLGYGIAVLGGRLQPVQIAGQPPVLSPSPTPIPSTYLNLPQLQVKLVVVARGITFFPGDRLQFQRPQFYQDQVRILSLPYYELALNSRQLFSDQFVSVGTNGFGLELPLYYNLTPTSNGILYIRHQQQLGRSYYATQPGWALDLIQGYSSRGGQQYQGSVGFTGLTRGDWGFQWNHNQEFNAATQGSLDLEFPNHNSMFFSSSLTQDFHQLRWGLNFGSGTTFIAPTEATYRTDMFAETQPKPLAGSRSLLYTLGTTFSDGHVLAGTGVQSFGETSEGVNLRVFSHPLLLGSRTSLNDSFSVGQSFGSGGTSGFTGLATLGLDQTFKGGGTMTLTYDFVTQPSGLFNTDGHHRVGATYNFATGKRVQALLVASTYLDAADSSVLGDFIYRIDPNYRLLFSATMQRFEGETYNDVEFTFGRRIGARELELTYSTFLKRVSVNFTATSF
ncbi:MAG: hypothetical protein KGJ62_03800 [Armatimonadetes bacterium]|nr:hypothetical protein [Armatimonadota bacterium]MDE2205977.1 hypothetical protein [Armatimonadota bacterium]